MSTQIINHEALAHFYKNRKTCINIINSHIMLILENIPDLQTNYKEKANKKIVDSLFDLWYMRDLIKKLK